MPLRVVLIGDWFRKPVLSLDAALDLTPAPPFTNNSHEWVLTLVEEHFFFSRHLFLFHDTYVRTYKFVFGICVRLFLEKYVCQMKSKFDISTWRGNRRFKNIAEKYFDGVNSFVIFLEMKRKKKKNFVRNLRGEKSFRNLLLLLFI